MANARALRAEKRSYASPAQIVRIVRALRGEGINPSSVKFGADGSIHMSANRDEGGVPSDFDVWNAAGKL